ncbi:11376_t:CDS:2 [Paraglomus occultum]|uniref:11376_t:CDS:1 n=1 Tax=Paraglomus occultum TaxID=144539 RepID=A0A9N8W6T6_9GLOM|nr:11376_t:CDS:2 [Paraglomus occultum]
MGHAISTCMEFTFDHSSSASTLPDQEEPPKSVFTNSDSIEEIMYLHHVVLKHYWGQNYVSPVVLSSDNETKPKQVLDLGCVTGLWTVEMASISPTTNFVGVNPFSIFPKSAPSNVSFYQQNILNGLQFDDNSFDFIHERLSLSDFTKKQWEDTVLHEIVRVCKPGGWIELLESDACICDKGKVLRRIGRSCKKLFLSKGLVPNLGQFLQTLLRSNPQLTDVHYIENDMPLGKRHGKFGELAVRDLMLSWNAIKIPLSQIMGIAPEHFEAILEAFINEVNVQDLYWRTYRVIARKKTLDEMNERL